MPTWVADYLSPEDRHCLPLKPDIITIIIIIIITAAAATFDVGVFVVVVVIIIIVIITIIVIIYAARSSFVTATFELLRVAGRGFKERVRRCCLSC